MPLELAPMFPLASALPTADLAAGLIAPSEFKRLVPLAAPAENGSHTFANLLQAAATIPANRPAVPLEDVPQEQKIAQEQAFAPVAEFPPIVFSPIASYQVLSIHNVVQESPAPPVAELPADVTTTASASVEILPELELPLLENDDDLGAAESTSLDDKPAPLWTFDVPLTPHAATVCISADVELSAVEQLPVVDFVEPGLEDIPADEEVISSEPQVIPQRGFQRVVPLPEIGSLDEQPTAEDLVGVEEEVEQPARQVNERIVPLNAVVTSGMIVSPQQLLAWNVSSQAPAAQPAPVIPQTSESRPDAIHPLLSHHHPLLSQGVNHSRAPLSQPHAKQTVPQLFPTRFAPIVQRVGADVTDSVVETELGHPDWLPIAAKAPVVVPATDLLPPANKLVANAVAELDPPAQPTSRPQVTVSQGSVELPAPLASESNSEVPPPQPSNNATPGSVSLPKNSTPTADAPPARNPMNGTATAKGAQPVTPQRPAPVRLAPDHRSQLPEIARPANPLPLSSEIPGILESVVGASSSPLSGLEVSHSPNRKLASGVNKVSSTSQIENRFADAAGIGTNPEIRAEATTIEHFTLTPESTALSPEQQVVQQVLERAEITSDTAADRYEFRLDPPELGEVVIEFQRGADGEYSVRVTAAHPQTHAWLEQRAGEMQQSLADQGLEMAQFDLSQHQESSREQNDQPDRRPWLPMNEMENSTIEPQGPQRNFNSDQTRIRFRA